jgi:hypothetical protein
MHSLGATIGHKNELPDHPNCRDRQLVTNISTVNEVPLTSSAWMCEWAVFEACFVALSMVAYHLLFPLLYIAVCGFQKRFVVHSSSPDLPFFQRDGIIYRQFLIDRNQRSTRPIGT